MGNVYSNYKKRKDEKFEEKMNNNERIFDSFVSKLSISHSDIINYNFTDNSRFNYSYIVLNQYNDHNIVICESILQFIAAFNLTKQEKVILDESPQYENTLNEIRTSHKYYVINLSIPSKNVISKTYVLKY